jgi:SAM-dependent methyltransferase
MPKKTVGEAENATYVSRMQLQYERTNEKALVSEALSKILGHRLFSHSLDVGPGPGEVTVPLAERTDRLTLVELNEDYREQLTQKFPTAKVIIDSIHNLSFSEEFDAILFSQALYYIPESQWISFIKSLFLFLKKQGSLFIVLNNEHGDFNRLVRSVWAQHPEAKTFAFRQSEEFRNDLSSLGQLNCHSLTYQWKFSPEDALSVVGSSVLAVSDKKMLNIIKETVSQFTQSLPTEGTHKVMNVGCDILELKRL